MTKNQKIPRVMDLRGTYKGGGGPDKTVLNSAAQHDPEKVHVLVTYLRQPWDDEFQIPEMARQLGINYVDVFDGKGIDWRCLRRLRQLLVEYGLEIVHAHDDKSLLYGWILRFLLPELRIMYTCHSHSELNTTTPLSGRALFSFRLRQYIQISLMSRYLKPIITVSRDTKNRLVRNGLQEQDVAVLYNGIDIEKWRPGKKQTDFRRELGIVDADLLVGTVARITPDKDLDTFFAVATRVNARMPDVHFVIVGDGYGKELECAKRQVQELGLDKVVIFTGHRNDLAGVYASFDLFLMTSRTEGLPNTALEAMAMQIAVVSTSVGGVPELVVDRESGLLAPAGDAAALAERTVELLRDRQRREAIALAGRRRIESHFSFSGRVSEMENYYLGFLTRSKD